MRSVKGEDLLIHNLRVELTAIEGTNVLEFAGEGKSDGVGMTIANLRLYKFQEPKKKIKNREEDNFLKKGNFA